MMNNDPVSAAGRARAACSSLIGLSSAQKNELLISIADALTARAGEIERANAEDIKNCTDKPPAFIDRLRFCGERIVAAAAGLRDIAALGDPVGKILEERELYNGLRLKKVTVPIGVIAIVYEARPNVTVDAAGLCLKSSNAALLRGSRDALYTNRAIVEIIRSTLEHSGVCADAVCLAECDRDGIKELLADEKNIDLAIPRGSKALIDFVRRSAVVPVIETGAGNCCAYIDGTADLKTAVNVVVNAKTQRIGVCNALESLLIERSALGRTLPVLAALDAAGVTLHADSAVCDMFGRAKPAMDADWSTEYLSMDISVKTVEDVREAVEYINNYGTHHSDVILTKDAAAADYFTANVDSAAVYVNASTRFTDGGEFGLGAEIGISTQKLHARGPMGLNEIVTYKYIIKGDGQTRG